MKNRRSSMRDFAFIFLWAIFLGMADATAEDRGLNVVAREVTGKEDFDIGRQYAVIIGIDRYKEWPALRSAVSEAKSIKKVLAERYYIDEFLELYDSEATASNIRRLFVDTLPRKIGARDSLLVFYAGHGQLDATKTGFWIAVDGTTDAYSQNNWIPNNQLRNMIGSLKAQRILILADACFSGDFLNVSRSAAPLIDSAYYRRALQLTARQVLTSGASESVPDESEYGKQLLNILERNDAPLLDPVSMYERLRLGVRQTLPLLGSMPGNEEGASFVLFLKSTTGIGTGTVTGGKPADLMVRASEAGAEILVDGVSRGKSPLLLSTMPSGRKLRIEARTNSSYGASEVSLDPGELRELSVAMTARTGNLFITSNENAVRVLFDGNDRGTLGSGILRDLPVGTHTLELMGQDLYFSSSVIILPESTVQLAAQVQPVGSLAIKIPADASVTIAGGGLSRNQKGPSLLSNLPVGTYSLKAVGDDWLPASAKVTVAKGQQTIWEPWKDGTIVFSVSPANAICLLDGGQTLEANRPATGVAPGAYKAILRRPGYRDKEIALVVAIGKPTAVKAILERLQPGIISTSPLGVDLTLIAEGQSFTATKSADGRLRFEGIPSGYPVSVRFASIAAFKLAVPEVTVNLAEGETTKLEIPSGSIALPWLASDASILMGGTRYRGQSSWTSPTLPVGTYRVEVGGTVAHKADVLVRAGSVTELPGYRDAAVTSLSGSRQSALKALAAKQVQSTAGWVSLAAGILGAAGAGAAYWLGGQAMTSYRAAPDTETAASQRQSAELYQIALYASGAVGGLGLAISPILLRTGPDPAILQRSIDSLDEGIKALGK